MKIDGPSDSKVYRGCQEQEIALFHLQRTHHQRGIHRHSAESAYAKAVGGREYLFFDMIIKEIQRRCDMQRAPLPISVHPVPHDQMLHPRYPGIRKELAVKISV